MYPAPFALDPSRRRCLGIAITLMLMVPGASPAWAVSTELLSVQTGATAGAQFGVSVGTAGDVNGDGFDDLIVGAHRDDAGGSPAGRAYVFYGGPGADTIANLTFTGAAADDQFGSSAGTAGDVNGDGFDDLIVGAPYNDAGGSDAGRAYVFYGGPGADTVADLTFTGEAVNDHFGNAVATAGDINGDGFDDLIVGADANDAGGPDAGRAYVFYGGPGADTTADLIFTGAAADDRFGFSVGTAGDVNGNGFDDLIIGAPYNDAGGSAAGRAYVFYGGPGADTTADLTFTGAAVGDLFGFSVGIAGDVNGDGFDDLIVGAQLNDAGGSAAGRAYVFYGGPGADAIANLTFTGETVFDSFGFSVGTAGDVNGDGFDDLIVGADGNDAAGSEAGRAYVFYGGPGADTIADLTFTGETAFDSFGFSVGTAGDVNGDGFDDLIVGANANDAGGVNAGRAYVYSVFPYRVTSPNGGEQWVAGESATVRWLGHDVADLSISYDGGSSWTTLAVGVGGNATNRLTVLAPTIETEGALVRLSYTGQPVSRSTSDRSDGVFRIVTPPRPVAHRLGSAPTGEAADDALGGSVAGVGDVNGDGLDDFMVGALQSSAVGPFAGRAYLYLGDPQSPATPALVLNGEGAGDFFGTVAGPGDVNGDGFDDMLVGALLNSAAGVDAGRAYLYFGGTSPDTTRDLTFTAEAAGDEFGWTVSGAGDMNGDGFQDLLIGAYANDAGGADAGRAYVYHGGPGMDAVADLILTGPSAGDNFGSALAAAGDVNGDGFDDILVGSEGFGGGIGRASLFYGGIAPDATADLVLTGEVVGDRFGGSVSGAGDINRDGYADVIVGARWSDAGGTDTGRAYLFLGGPDLDPVPDLIMTGEAASDFLGVSVAGAGDVNGDGFDDFAVGAHFADGSGSDLGRVYLFHGAPIPDAVADLVLTGEAPLDRFGTTVAGAGDVTGDGFADLLVGADRNDTGGSDAGRAYLYDCNRYHVLSPAGGATWNVGAGQTVSWLGAEPADLWLSVDGGDSYSLLRDNVGGLALNSVGLTVPHRPTRFAKVKVTPHAGTVAGRSESDSLFTIEASIALLNLKAEPFEGGGVLLSWETDPGPQDLAGYKVERSPVDGEIWTVLATRVRETEYLDASGAAGMRYRLSGINGLGEELLLGETALTPRAALAAWPIPYRGGDLNLSFATSSGQGGGSRKATVAVFDLNGRLVRTIASGDYEAGYQIARWDGRDENGRNVSSGVYFLRATSAGESNQIKLIVIR